MTRRGGPSDRAAAAGLIGPWLGRDRVESFRADHWETAPLVAPVAAPAALAEAWPTVAHIEELVTHVDFPVTNLDLADGVEPLPAGRYTVGGTVDRAAVVAHHRRGATIILRSAHRWSRPLRELCARLEWDLGFPVQANVYLTPAGHQSTPPHWDTHDLFVLQVRGTKVWRLYGSDHPLPLDDERFDADAHTVGPHAGDLAVREGEILFLPRGTIHAPVAESDSIHVSLGVLVSRWADLVTPIVAAAAARAPELRTALPLPPGGLHGDLGPLADALSVALEHARGEVDARAAVASHLAEVLSRHQPRVGVDPGTGLVPGPVDEHSVLALAPSTYVWTEDRDDRRVVRWAGGTFSAPRSFGPLLDRVLGGAPFTPAAAPEAASPEERVAACQALVEAGLLRVLVP